MNTADLLALFPLLLIAAIAVVVMLGIAFKRSPALAAGLTVAGLTAAFVSIWAAAPVVPRQVTPLLLVDNIRPVLHWPDRRLRRGRRRAVATNISRSMTAIAKSYTFCFSSRLLAARSW